MINPVPCMFVYYVGTSQLIWTVSQFACPCAVDNMRSKGLKT